MNFIKEVITSTFDIRDYGIKAETVFPREFELSILPGVKDQGSKPTCVAHAASSVIEYFYQKEHNKKRIFSTEFIYGFRDLFYYIGDGMMIRNALDTLKEYGDPFNSICPGNNDYKKAMENVEANLLDYLLEAEPYRIASYYRCKNSEEIKTALMNHGPVLVSMNTYKNAKVVDDVYTYDTNNESGRHCVMVYGWNEKGWLIQNSWGKTWAGDGRFILPFDYKFNEMWGMTDKKDDELIKKPSKFKIWIHKLYNYIVNLFIKED